jgi:hypothetical protein
MPSALDIQMRPRGASTMFFHMKRPDPVPFVAQRINAPMRNVHFRKEDHHDEYPRKYPPELPPNPEPISNLLPLPR